MLHSTMIKDGEVTISKEVYSVTVPEGAYRLWKSGSLIQDIFPDLTTDQREFMITGFTPTEYAAMFGDLEL